jgi:hypothetical protein
MSPIVHDAQLLLAQTVDAFVGAQLEILLDVVG